MVQRPSLSDVFPKKRMRLQAKPFTLFLVNDNDTKEIQAYALFDQNDKLVYPKQGHHWSVAPMRYVGSPDMPICKTPDAAWALIEGEDLDLIPPETPLFAHQIVYIDGTQAETIISEQVFNEGSGLILISGVDGRMMRVTISQVRSHTITQI